MNKIEIKCTGTTELALSEMTELQGNFKTLTSAKADKLKQSLKKHGFWFPFYCWKDETEKKIYFIDGHQRNRVLPILKKEGWELPKKYPVIFIHAKDKSEAAKAILLQTSAYGVPSEDSLYEFLYDFGIADDWMNLKYEADLPFFNMQEFEDGWLINSGEVKDVDEIPEKPKTVQTKIGDLYELKSKDGKRVHRVMCGDSTKRANVEKLMNGQEANLFSTDPPFGVGYDKKKKLPLRRQNKRDWENLYFEIDEKDMRGFYDSLLESWEQSLENNAAFFIWFSPKNFCDLKVILEKHKILDHQIIVWEKPISILRHLIYRIRAEFCMFGWKKGFLPFVREGMFSKSEFSEQIWRVDWEGRKSHSADLHPTQKPIKLFSIPIDHHTRSGEICAEPFLGSGSQLIACEQTGRICYGMELQPLFVDVVMQRYVDFIGCDEIVKNGKSIKWKMT